MNFVEKISSYNLITNLIPGIILLEALRVAGLPVAKTADLGAWLALSYALGLLSARIGSVAVAPAIRKILRDQGDSNSYSDFVVASKSDSKIDILVETANCYRTIVGANVLYVITIAGYYALLYVNQLSLVKFLAPVPLVIIFGISYVKQSRYVTSRVRANGGTNGSPYDL